MHSYTRSQAGCIYLLILGVLGHSHFHIQSLLQDATAISVFLVLTSEHGVSEAVSGVQVTLAINHICSHVHISAPLYCAVHA